MTDTWDPKMAGILRLPSGRLVRGRALKHPLPPCPPPTFALYLLGQPPPPVDWDSTWIPWPDFRLPSNPATTRHALQQAWKRAETERVEIACTGGRGRTGTALACMAILDGLPNREAVPYIRLHYSPHAVETPWQRRFVLRFH